MRHWWGKTLKWSRTFHIYMTLVALVTLLFFATTGFVMNHAEWFENPSATSTESGTVPAEILKGDRLAVTEYLRKNHHAIGEVTTYDAREDEIEVQFKSPGRTSDVRITKEGGAVEVTHEMRGLFGVVSDMHRAQNTGRVWKLVLDATAILVVASTITGFTMWLGLRTRRKAGLVGLGLSVVTVGTVFFLALR